MENFFTYISKPVDKEEVQTWIERNDICYQKFDLYHDFVNSLISLIYNTYLGDNVSNSTNINFTDEDNSNHFEWCWKKTVNNFKKEDVNFEMYGDHFDFFKGFIMETFYNQKLNEVKFSLDRFFNEIFNLNSMYTMSDLDLLRTIYKSLDRNLSNNNLH